jgi:choline dehydrogenase-like flavoprotein
MPTAYDDVVVGAGAAGCVLAKTGRAIGIEAQTAGTISTYEASREVILSAGAINSPQLLLHVTANLNAPVIMIAEKLADAILGKSPLPPSRLTPH